MKNFAIIGAGGYVAPRHMKAMKELGGNLIAALDKSDSVGILDSFFPDAHFFTEFERFDRFVDKKKRKHPSEKIDYFSVCSPNYLHDSHIRFGLRSEGNVICEKPVVLNPHNIDSLIAMEKETGGITNSILQLRLHPEIIKIKNSIIDVKKHKKFDVDLTYITSRGRWYDESWKGDIAKSGGVSTNIGVHFFDLLGYLFGALQKNILHKRTKNTEAGFLEYEKARVRWFLSTDKTYVPKNLLSQNQMTYRSILIDNKKVELSKGFNDLHTKSYELILNGKGYGLEDTRRAIETVSEIRKAQTIGKIGDYHPLLNKDTSI